MQTKGHCTSPSFHLTAVTHADIQWSGHDVVRILTVYQGFSRPRSGRLWLNEAVGGRPDPLAAACPARRLRQPFGEAVLCPGRWFAAGADAFLASLAGT